MSVTAPAISADQFASIYPRLRRLAAVAGDLDCDPDDLVQDALVGYLRRFDGTDGAEDPEAYLRTMVVGLAKNHRRSQGRRRRREALGAPTERFQSCDVELSGLLDGVAPIDRALLEAVDIEGEPISVAAKELGMSAVAARARLSRARRTLRNQLAEEER
jgi:RNA polymerase sigma factor (sigma-70 family)